MRYKYEITNHKTKFRGKTVTPTQLAKIIKRDVECGRWNTYDGGSNTTTAHCRYQGKTFTYHEKLLIYGTKKEFQQLEKLIDNFIYVEPRTFK